MFADGRSVPSGEVIQTSVCVIGGGAAGLAIARELGAAGLEVVLLERGPDRGPAKPPDTVLNVGLPYDLDDSRWFEVGGALQRWRVHTPLGRGFGRMRELEAIDFERRDWVPHSGWPFAKDHLDPFYARARKMFDTPWPSEAPEQLWDSTLDTGPFATSGLVTRVFYFSNPGVFPGPIWRSVSNSDRIVALTNAAAVELRSHASGNAVTSLAVRTAQDHAFEVEAETYVVAAGGIEAARLLLVSRDCHVDGVGNAEGLVGRYFMEHPHYASGQLIPASRAAFEDPSHFAIHLHGDVPLQKKYTLPEATVRQEGLLGCTFRFEAKPVTDSDHTLRYSERALNRIDTATAAVRAAVRREQGVGPAVRASIVGAPHIARHLANRSRVRLGRARGRTRYLEPQSFWIRAMAEQVPNPDSRVRLRRDRDPLGVPLVDLDWRMTEQDRLSMGRSQDLLAAAVSRTGNRVESLLDGRELPPALSGGMHHMGTTRMHDSPRMGVVDRHGRVHGVSNLYIAGSAVFPTVGYANPTLTLLALSLRLADRIRSLERR